MRFLALIIVSALCVWVACCQPPIRVGFYNVQNLYDTINDPAVDDAEFLPSAPSKWNSEKYFKKIEQLASVIKSINSAIMGLCEVENRGVVSDLAAASGGLYVVHYDSRDARGIDVALLVDTAKIEVIESEPIRVGAGIRDFLKVIVGVKSTDLKFEIYVAHLPSKLGGALAGRRRDMALNFIDSVGNVNRDRKVIFLGDMNDAPREFGYLYNAALAPAKNGMGSYAYRDLWTMPDQILFTYPFKSYIAGNQVVFLHKSLITPEGRYKGYPHRSRPSDHFPIYIDIGGF